MGVLLILPLSACQKMGQVTAENDPLVGCYTVSKSEPAQIKISQTDGQYAMQMRRFNQADQDWDNPEPMQVLANNSDEIKTYFGIKTGESKFLQKVIARPDRVFVLAKLDDSFASLNPQYDSPYLGYIYKGSNTVYKVSCSGGKTV